MRIKLLKQFYYWQTKKKVSIICIFFSGYYYDQNLYGVFIELLVILQITVLEQHLLKLNPIY